MITTAVQPKHWLIGVTRTHLVALVHIFDGYNAGVLSRESASIFECDFRAQKNIIQALGKHFILCLVHMKSRNTIL